VATSALFASAAVAKNFGSIKVATDNGEKTVYVVGTWGNVRVHDNGFTMDGGARVYLAEKATDNFDDPNMFWEVPLIGNHFSYDMDISRVDCHLNAAAYFVNMPAHNSSHQPDKGKGGDWYCDANDGNNFWCPEYDTFEGNKYTMATTLHTCQYQAPNFYPSCDRGGCQTNAYNAVPNGYCPRDDCKINTNKPFTISHAAISPDGQIMTGTNNWFKQGNNEMSFNACNNGDYQKNMGYSLHGTVFVASLWGGNGINMDWLDGMTHCWSNADLNNASVTFSNFQLKKNTAVEATLN